MKCPCGCSTPVVKTPGRRPRIYATRACRNRVDKRRARAAMKGGGLDPHRRESEFKVERMRAILSKDSLPTWALAERLNLTPDEIRGIAARHHIKLPREES